MGSTGLGWEWWKQGKTHPRRARAPATVNGAKAWWQTHIEGGELLRAGERGISVRGVAGGEFIRTVEGKGPYRKNS